MIIHKHVLVIVLLITLGELVITHPPHQHGQSGSSEAVDNDPEDLVKLAKDIVKKQREPRSASSSGSQEEASNVDKGSNQSSASNSSESSVADSSESSASNSSESSAPNSSESTEPDSSGSIADQSNIDEDAGANLDTPEQPEPTALSRRKRGVSAVDPDKEPDRLWTSPINWDMDPKLASKTQKTIKESIALIEENTCLKFKRKAKGDHMYFKLEGVICEAGIGHSGGQQVIKISEDKTSGCVSDLLISHEIFHSLGLDHDIKRKDVGKLIKINLPNIEPNMRSQFKQDKRLKEWTALDIWSAMGYPSGFGAKNRNVPTEETVYPQQTIYLNPSFRTYLKPSFQDYRTLNMMYKCVDPCQHQKCDNGGYKRTLASSPKKCVCNCPTGTKGRNCETIVDRCGKLLTDKSGTIEFDTGVSSPIADKLQEKHCTWIVHADEGQTSHVSFYDYVTIPDTNVDNYLEIHSNGIGYAGLRETGNLSPAKMAYSVKGPFLIDFGLKDPGFNVGFKFKYSVVNKDCTSKKCYNGGELTAKCTCKCAKGFSGSNCETNDNKSCNKKKDCLNRAHRDSSQKGCPCICPPPVSDKDAKKYGISSYSITGDLCQYFGDCYARSDSAASINTLLGKVGVAHSDLYTITATTNSEKACAKMKAKDGFSCKNDLSLQIKCPITCSTRCACTNAMDKIDAAKSLPIGSTCKAQKSACAQVGPFCQNTCKMCSED